jgi:hypothetical protein
VNGKCEEKTEWYVLLKHFTDNSFSDISGWVLENVEHAETAPFTQCGDVRLVGGCKKFGKGALAKRSFTLPRHK